MASVRRCCRSCVRLVAPPLVRRAGGAGGPRHAPHRRERRPAARRSRRRTALLGGVRPLPRRARGVRPFAALSAGALRTSGRGTRRRPNQGRPSTSGRFSPTRASGRSCGCPTASTCRWRAHAQLAEPYLGVRFVDTVVATSGAAQPARRRSRSERGCESRVAAPARCSGPPGWPSAACSRADLDAITAAGPTAAVPARLAPVTLPARRRCSPATACRRFRSASVSRSYLLHVPPAYDGSKPVPLLVDFHAMPARGCRSDSELALSGADRSGRRRHGLPDRALRPLGRGLERRPCCVANVDDVAFTRALVAQVSTMACIDPKRVYATGFSMGGGMAHYSPATRPTCSRRWRPPVRSAGRKRRRLPAAAPHHGDLLPWQRGHVRAVRRRIFFVRPGHAGHVPRRAGHVPEVGGIDQCTGSAVGADNNGCSTYASCPGRGRGRAVHEGGRRPGAG